MSIAEYQVAKLPIIASRIVADILIGEGWQPMGAPAMVPPYQGHVCQVFVKGSGEVTDYEVLKMPVDTAQELMQIRIAEGWQPMGGPVMIHPDTKTVIQAVVKGVPAGGGQAEVTAASISDASAIGRSVLTAPSQAEARTAMGAGTSSLGLGSTAATAAAGNHNHAVTADAGSGLAAAATIQALAAALSARIQAVESRVAALEAP